MGPHAHRCESGRDGARLNVRSPKTEGRGASARPEIEDSLQRSRDGGRWPRPRPWFWLPSSLPFPLPLPLPLPLPFDLIRGKRAFQRRASRASSSRTLATASAGEGGAGGVGSRSSGLRRRGDSTAVGDAFAAAREPLRTGAEDRRVGVAWVLRAVPVRRRLAGPRRERREWGFFEAISTVTDPPIRGRIVGNRVGSELRCGSPAAQPTSVRRHFSKIFAKIVPTSCTSAAALRPCRAHPQSRDQSEAAFADFRRGNFRRKNSGFFCGAAVAN